MSAQIFVAETLGTFILVCVILATGEAVSIGIALAAAIYVASFASGGHLNCAVSTVMLFKGRITSNDFPFYIAGQLCGAFAALYWYNMVPQKSSVHR